MRGAVYVDPLLCRGTALCRSTAPHLFDIGADGKAVPLRTQLADQATLELAEEVADCCPMEAIIVERHAGQT